MATDLQRGRQVKDIDRVGGLRAAYFINYDESSSTGALNVTFDSTNVDVIEALGGASATPVSMFKYDLRGTSNLEQSQQASRENGTILVEQTLTLDLKGISIEDHQDMYNLAAGRPHILVEDYNGTLQLVGLEYGADGESSTISTGSSMTDKSGYTWVFKAMEKKPANIVDETAVWVAGETGSVAVANYFNDISINGNAGTTTR